MAAKNRNGGPTTCCVRDQTPAPGRCGALRRFADARATAVRAYDSPDSPCEREPSEVDKVGRKIRDVILQRWIAIRKRIYVLRFPSMFFPSLSW
jgi:hypothetical protein